MSWRLAKSLGVLRDQFNKLAPDRLTDSDGTIGDAGHAARTSDHNPNEDGVVCALDITHDPAHGVDTYEIADQLRKTHDRRIKYIISNRRIAMGHGDSPWEWQHYSGSNPHDHHFHTSVQAPHYDDTEPWKFELTKPQGVAAAPTPSLKVGSTGDRVQYLQGILKIAQDGDFGPLTRTAVQIFQRAHNLADDGIVGPYTWRMLLDGTTIPSAGPLQGSGLFMSGRGSWFSQFKGKNTWSDSGDRPGSNALGVPDSAQGIALYDAGTLGRWFEVKAPNGEVSVEQQTDIGPHPTTGRKIDISAAAAERFGYTPKDFPTNATFQWRPIPTPSAVVGLTPRQQGQKFVELRKDMEKMRA